MKDYANISNWKRVGAEVLKNKTAEKFYSDNDGVDIFRHPLNDELYGLRLFGREYTGTAAEIEKILTEYAKDDLSL